LTEGLIRKFSDPAFLAAASSPLTLPGQDPVVRTTSTLNRNTLRPDKFIFNVARANAVNFFCRGVVLPGMNCMPASVESPTHDVPYPGDKLIFEPLIVYMAIAEDFSNYLEIQRWMRGIAGPSANLENRSLTEAWQGKEVSDASVSFMTNAGGYEQIRFRFENAWPSALESIRAAPDAANSEIIMAVTFFYSIYDIDLIPDGNPP
jgi:hypothetical protein